LCKLNRIKTWFIIIRIVKHGIDVVGKEFDLEGAVVLVLVVVAIDSVVVLETVFKSIRPKT
jgi:hypothetical protein